jgi:uncharacterized membrane protein
MIRVKLYTNESCSLCEDVKADLESLQSIVPHEVIEIDISNDPSLHAEYVEKIPVVDIGPYSLIAPITKVDLEVALRAAQDSFSRLEEKDQSSGKYAVTINKVVYFFAQHWLAIINLAILAYIGLPFLAPTLMKVGAERPARLIYTVYSPLCHQLSFRSWFLYGDQPAYPLESSGTSSGTYEEITGTDQVDYIEASRYVGDETVGYKVAICQRDIAIYGGMFLAGLFFVFVRGWLKPAPLILWFLIGVVPLALDGGTQLISHIPFIGLAVRESTPFLRTLTGLLFGIMNVWLAYPYIEETMNDTQTLTAGRLASIGELEKS